MTLEDRASLKEFRDIALQAMRACYRRDGFADLSGVWEEMERTNGHTVKRLVPSFGRQYQRIIVQQMLKRNAMNNGHQHQEAEAAEVAASQQPEFDFADIEQFRGAPVTISLEDRPGHVIYVPFQDSTRRQRELSLKLLDASIHHDTDRREAQARGTRFADTLADLYGDLPVKELIRLWRAARRGGAAGV